ncbi:MAG: serine/threonine-protein kinase, partial [Myxococcota bacterium]
MDAPLSERPAILERACGDDASLRAEVEALLDADAAGDDDVMAGLGAAVAAVAGEVDDTAVELAEVGLARGAMVDGRYEVKEVLGRGGMGVVVGAEHTGLGEPVALKVLKPGAMTSERARRRFIREARAAAKMRSPHVVAVRDVGTLSSGAPYLVMDRLHGVDLATVIEQRGALPVDEASLIVLQVCEALATAHRRGVIHRDIKPANIFLERAEHGEVAVKLLDFGISKVVDEGDTLTGTSDLVGSPAYMSPEQLRASRDVDVRADVWSLGVVFYEMLAGARPFRADSVADVSMMILVEAPSPLPEALPARVGDIVARCLRKRREDRFSSVGTLAAAVAPLAGAEGLRGAGRVQTILGARPAPTPEPFDLADTVAAEEDA